MTLESAAHVFVGLESNRMPAASQSVHQVLTCSVSTIVNVVLADEVTPAISEILISHAGVSNRHSFISPLGCGRGLRRHPESRCGDCGGTLHWR